MDEVARTDIGAESKRSDGGYNGVVAGNEITRAGCWAHMKRKVIDAEKAAPEIAREA